MTRTKGHWPAGKRRNVTDDAAQPVLAAVAEVLAKRRAHGTVSHRALAATLGVSHRTIARWLRREDNPPADMLRRLKRWAEKHQ